MLISKFCETQFSSYEDFKSRFRIQVPENFNFAYDVVDELAPPSRMRVRWSGATIRAKKEPSRLPT